MTDQHTATVKENIMWVLVKIGIMNYTDGMKWLVDINTAKIQAELDIIMRYDIGDINGSSRASEES